jgi:broad specificity phosphatase PhoE
LYWMGMPLNHVFRIQVSNASITRIELEHFDGQWFPRLLFHGGHL